MPRFRNPSVGVGADNIFEEIGQRFFEDEDARKRRETLEDAARAQQFQQQGMPSAQAEARVQQERQFTPDPLRWVQERAEDTRRNPIIGGLRSLGALPEAAGTAARYATGVALAPVQAGAQAYGWNAPEAVNQIASNTQNLPGADLPFLGGLIRGDATLAGIATGAFGTAGRTTGDLLSGTVPQQRGDLAGQHLNESGYWSTPVPTWENPFDPREALQRSRALAGPGEMAPELMAGNVPFGAMAAGARGLAGGAAGGFLTDTGVLGSVHDNPLASFFAPGRGALGAAIPPAVGAVAGAVSPITGNPEGTETSITDRLMGAGEGFLMGSVLGMATSPLERRLGSLGAKAPSWQPELNQAADTILRGATGGNELADTILPSMFKANAQAQGFEGRARYPGGSARAALDKIPTVLHDELQPIGTLADYLDQAMADRLRAAGADLPKGAKALEDQANPYIRIALTRNAGSVYDYMAAQTTKEIAQGRPLPQPNGTTKFAGAGGILPDENDLFNASGQFRTMLTASDQGALHGPYLDKFNTLVQQGMSEANALAAVKVELQEHDALFRKALLAQFPGRADILDRFETVHAALANLNNAALVKLADAEVLAHTLVHGVPGTPDVGLLGRYGDQWGYLEEAGTAYTSITGGQAASKDYLARQRAAGVFHSAEEMPAYTIDGHLQRARQAVALAEHNEATLTIPRAMEMLGETDPQTGQFLGIPGLIEPQTKHPAPVIGPDGQPAIRMVYDDHVPNDMGIIPYWEVGTDETGRSAAQYKEVLVPKAMAEALNSANVDQHNLATGVMAAQARFFARGVTSWAPFFPIMHGIRQVQEALEKTARGQLGPAANAFYQTALATAAQGAKDFGETHPNNPLVQALPQKMGDAINRVIANNPETFAMGTRDLFSQVGGPGATLNTQIGHGPQSAREALGMTNGGAGSAGWLPQGREWFGTPVTALVQGIKTYAQGMQTLTQVLDEAPRLAHFSTALEEGKAETIARYTKQALDVGFTPGEAAASAEAQFMSERLPTARYAAQTLTNDFSRMGTAGRVLNQVLPLLNARKEGFVTSVGGALEDPQKFATRMSAWMGLPTILAYAANRLAYGDAYDDIPITERDTYSHVPYGWWQDEYGRDHPLTIKVIKSPFIQALTAPLEALMDHVYHLTNDGEYLADAQRTQRPDQRMWLTSLARMTPLEGQPDTFSDVKHLAFAAASMQPLASMAVEMAANEDHFTGRDIIPPEKRLLPPQYQYGIGTSMTAKLAGQYLHQSPGVLDQFAADMFGTAGRSAMHVPDLIAGILQKHGLLDTGDPFAPKTPADLPNLAGLPPEVVNRYLDQMQHDDQRPLQGQLFPRFFGTAYSGRSIQERAKQLGPDEKERWEDTLEYNRHSQEIKVEYSRLRSNLENRAGDMTNAAYRDHLWQLTMQEKGARAQLATDYAGRAWTSPAERQAAINAMPGTSVDGFQKSLAQLPPGTDVAALANQWEAIGQQGNAPTVASMRNKWLQQTSQQLHVSASTILDYLGSYHLGNELVGLPAPTEDLERLRIEHAAPMDPKDPTKQLDPFTTPPDKFRAAQRAVIANYASMWGVPEGNLLERLNARYHLPGETVGPVQAQQQLAAMVETRFHNPDEYPRYASPSGQAVGTPDDWTIWDQQLDDARNKYGDQRNRWPGGIRALDDARRYGDSHRYMDMYRHAVDGEPAEREAALAQIVAWERFYGTGRNATLNEWQSFMSNGQTKYKADITPQTALAWDAMYQNYRLMPPGPEKNRLRPFAERIRRTMNPRWQRIIDERDAVGSELQQT